MTDCERKDYCDIEEKDIDTRSEDKLDEWFNALGFEREEDHGDK